MEIKKKLLDVVTWVLKSGIRIAGEHWAPRICVHLSEQLTPVIEQKTSIGTLNFFCPSPLPLWRARTLMTKEPETIAWINSFEKTDVLWDIGANVGVYSLYAALRGVAVVAFEPAPGNYYILSRNIEINGFGDRIASFCVALNDDTRLASFHMQSTELGGALSSFGEAIDYKGEPYTAKFKQAMVGYSIDDFIHQFTPLFPNHIKIDVDGIEKKIVRGASKTLSDKRLKSVLLELNINLEESSEIIGIMNTYGLALYKREHADGFYLGEMAGIYNHIFMRKT